MANPAKARRKEPVATEVVQVYRMNDSDDDEPSICVVCLTAEEPGYALISAMCHDCLSTECGQCKDHKTCPACSYGTCAACWGGHTERCAGSGRRKIRKIEQSRKEEEQGVQQPSKLEPTTPVSNANIDGDGTNNDTDSYETRLDMPPEDMHTMRTETCNDVQE